jgi:hypothetical protein
MRQSGLTVVHSARGRRYLEVTIFSGVLLYWLGRAGTFEGSLSWQHQLVGHVVSLVAGTALGWILITRREGLQIHAPRWGGNLLIAAVLIDALARALVGQSWQAPEFAAAAFASAVF